MKKLIAVAALAAFATTEATAQVGFYVVQDVKTKRCTVVKERPTTKEVVIVGPEGKVYATEAEATTAIRTIKVCEVK